MEFSVAEVFDRERVIATAGIPGLRLFAVQKNASDSPLSEPVDLMYPAGWVPSSPSTVCGAEYDNDGYSKNNTLPYCGPHCGPSAAVKSFHRATWGYFSAVCFLYGRALLRETGRPQGLIESCWGGTAIQKWTPGSGALYNGMISPLQNSPIRGAIWYQGEANAGAPNPYADQMRDMIQAWRTGWNNPPPLKNFSFILQQLSACTYGGDVPALRWSQQGAVSPWSTLENVAMTVGLDLYDPESPCANVHIRNKTAVGERMALAARAITYNDPTAAASFTGPVASTFSFTPLSAPTAIVVGYAAGTTLPLQFRTINQTTNASLQGFEVQYGAEWVPASAEVGAPALSAGNRVTSTSGTASAAVTVRLPRGRPTGIRYAWESIPTTQLLFDSTLVSDTAGLHGLPAPPFWANCTAAGCRLVTPGFIPGHPPPPPPTPPTPPSPPFPPFCPEPPLPTDSTCTFYNQTTVTAAGGGSRVQVPLYGYAECCKACTAKPGCTAALLYHGPLRAEYDFCDLYTQPLARLNRTTVAEVCPSLSVVILPGSQ